MSWFVGQYRVRSHRVAIPADLVLIDEIPAVTGVHVEVRAKALAGIRRVMGRNPDGAFAAPTAVLGNRTVTQRAALGAKEAPRFGLAVCGRRRRGGWGV